MKLNVKKILVVDDDEKMVDLANDCVFDWNAEEPGLPFEVIDARSVEGAHKVLSSHKIDCALIDLRLPDIENGDVTSAENGNELANYLIGQVGVPTAIISGEPKEADEYFQKPGTSEVFSKDGDAHKTALEWFSEQWVLMEALSSVRENMEKSTAEVFAQRIWPQWSEMMKDVSGDRHRLETVFTRQYASHVAEFLGGGEEDWHPNECYIVPSYQKDRAHTGDVFCLDDKYFIILSPQCDMATRKIEQVLLATCEIGREHWGEHLEHFTQQTSKNKVAKADKFFRGLVNQDLPSSEHFLPPLPGLNNPVIVKFSKVRTIGIGDLEASLEARVASVAPAFLSNLTQRFGAYISRTGQPNICIEDFVEPLVE